MSILSLSYSLESLFIFIIFVHNFDYLIYITSLLFLFMLLFNGTSFKVSGTLVLAAVLFALLSSLFMILYGDGTHVLFKWGFIQVSIESLVRGLHVSLRTISVSMFGILLALTSQIVMIFYSLMQHLKVKLKSPMHLWLLFVWYHLFLHHLFN